jgi:hypothetical protein
MIEVKGEPVDYEKQIRFAAASSLTAIAREGQKASIAKIESTFITRNPWYLPSNRLGIHMTPATKETLQARVSTNAGSFLGLHETGGLKQPQDGRNLAIPTRALRANPRQTIPAALRPRNLRGAFTVQTSRGRKLLARVGGQLKTLYLLRRQVRIRQQSTVIQPVATTFEQRFSKIFGERLANAIKTAKP